MLSKHLRRRSWRSTRLLHLEALETRCVLSTYTVTDLGTLGGAESYAFGLNNAGQVVGRAQVANRHLHPFVWDNGVMTDLDPDGVPNGFADPAAGAINEAGQIVGSAFVPYRAALWQDGQVIDLGTLGGQHSAAGSINNASQIAGDSDLSGGGVHAIIWQDGAITDLGTLPGGGNFTFAAGINESGQVAGTVATADRSFHAAWWQQNIGWTDLGTLPNDPQSEAHGINNLGHIVGFSGDEDVAGAVQAFFYNGTTMIPAGPAGSFPYGINDSDQVVGSMIVAFPAVQHAYIYANGVVTDLNDLIPPDSGVTLEAATAINNNGQIVGYTSSLGVNPKPHAFLLTPDQGTAARRIDPAVLAVAAPRPITIADVTHGSPANASLERAPVETGALPRVNATLPQAVDAVFAMHYRPEGLARPDEWLTTIDLDGAALL